jgi:hypothetical protein
VSRLALLRDMVTPTAIIILALAVFLNALPN